MGLRAILQSAHFHPCMPVKTPLVPQKSRKNNHLSGQQSAELSRRTHAFSRGMFPSFPFC
jgi:hypothetical protein